MFFLIILRIRIGGGIGRQGIVLVGKYLIFIYFFFTLVTYFLIPDFFALKAMGEIFAFLMIFN